MPQIKYVGCKPSEDAFRDRTGGIVWKPGSSHFIADKDLAAKMLQHPDVFALDGEAAPLTLKAAAAPAPTASPAPSPAPAPATAAVTETETGNADVSGLSLAPGGTVAAVDTGKNQQTGEPATAPSPAPAPAAAKKTAAKSTPAKKTAGKAAGKNGKGK